MKDKQTFYAAEIYSLNMNFFFSILKQNNKQKKDH